jgi:hypothetical protein
VNLSRLLPFAPIAVLVAATSCSPPAPRLQIPSRTEANCESKSVKQTAIDSIVASTDDTVRSGTYPGDALLRKKIKGGGGVFAYWNGQPLRVPDTAKALGVSGDPVLKRAVIMNDINAAEHWRPVWLTFETPHGEVTVLERAYDLQNVCVEGRRQA